MGFRPHKDSTKMKKFQLSENWELEIPLKPFALFDFVCEHQNLCDETWFHCEFVSNAIIEQNLVAKFRDHVVTIIPIVNVSALQVKRTSIF